MNAISRWDPVREMRAMRRMMDRFFDDALVRPDDWGESFSFSLPLDVREDEDEYIVEASVPGVKPEDLEVTYNNNILTIRGETKAEEEKQGESYHLRERRFGSFSRSITLPTPIKQESIEAKYQDGVLKLHLPKAEEAKPRRIEIHDGGSTRRIEGRTSSR